MPFSIAITNARDQTVCVVRQADPVPPTTDDATNHTFEEAISDVACAKRGDLIEITDTVTGEKLLGCIFKHRRQGQKGSAWYAEIMYVTALATEDGQLSNTWSACSVWTDHMERINLVKLVPKGCTYDDGDNDFDPEVTNPASPGAGSPRSRRRIEAYTEHQKTKS